MRRDTYPMLADAMDTRHPDNLSRRHGEWRIDERTVVFDSHRVGTWSANASLPSDGLSRGAQRARDPVHSLITEPGC